MLTPRVHLGETCAAAFGPQVGALSQPFNTSGLGDLPPRVRWVDQPLPRAFGASEGIVRWECSFALRVRPRLRARKCGCAVMQCSRETRAVPSQPPPPPVGASGGCCDGAA
jgi:hypothetical protein